MSRYCTWGRFCLSWGLVSMTKSKSSVPTCVCVCVCVCMSAHVYVYIYSWCVVSAEIEISRTATCKIIETFQRFSTAFGTSSKQNPDGALFHLFCKSHYLEIEITHLCLWTWICVHMDNYITFCWHKALWSSQFEIKHAYACMHIRTCMYICVRA